MIILVRLYIFPNGEVLSAANSRKKRSPCWYISRKRIVPDQAGASISFLRSPNAIYRMPYTIIDLHRSAQTDTTAGHMLNFNGRVGAAERLRE